MPVTWSDEKLILLYCPGRGSNSRPSAHRGFKHGQGVPRPYSLGHGGGRNTLPHPMERCRRRYWWACKVNRQTEGYEQNDDVIVQSSQDVATLVAQ